MVKIYEQSIFCETENTYVKSWENTTTLITTCPNDTTHTVTAGSTSIENSIEDKIVKIREEENIGFTGGAYKIEGKKFTANAGPNVKTIHAFTTDFNIAISSGTMTVNSDQSGDEVSIFIAPYTTIGALITHHALGETTFNVSPTVIENMKVGRFVNLVDTNGNSSERVLVVGMGTSSITIKNSLDKIEQTSSFQSGSSGTSIILNSSSDATDDHYNNMYIKIASGEIRKILDYVGSTKTATIDSSFSSDPAQDDTYVIYDVSKTEVVSAVQAGSSSTSLVLNSGANVIDDYYNEMFIQMTSGTSSGETRRIINYNGTTKTATLVSAFSSDPSDGDTYIIYRTNYLATTPTYVQMSIIMVEKFHINTTGTLTIGSSIIGATAIPGNTLIHFEYFNASGSSKTVSYSFEYFY